MTKANLMEAVSERVSANSDVRKKDVEAVVDALLETIKAEVASSSKLRLYGFGTFSKQWRKPRTGRNPQTGEPLEIEGRHVVKFKPSKTWNNQL